MKNEVTHDIPTITMEEMSIIEWGLNSLLFVANPFQREKIEKLLEKLNDC